MTQATLSKPTIAKSIFLAAPRATVWQFLTQKEKLALWFHPAKSDLALNEDYALISTGDDGVESQICWGKVLELDEPTRLVYTFSIKPLAGQMTTVIWTLEAVDGGTRLSLEHKGISEAAGEAAMGLLMALDAGWDMHFKSMREALSA